MAINDKLQNIIDTKTAIGAAIVNKGGNITNQTPFYSYAGEIDNIVTGGGGDFTIEGYDTNRIDLIRSGINTGGGTGDLRGIAVNNGFIYTGSPRVRKYREDNFMFINQTANYGQRIDEIKINNGKIYVAGSTPTTSLSDIKVYDEETLQLINNSAPYNGPITAMFINNGFIYIGGTLTASPVNKYYEDNLEFVGSSAPLNGAITRLKLDDNFIYAGVRNILNDRNSTMMEFHESNLEFTRNTPGFGGNL
jgi:hypothetical protein